MQNLQKRLSRFANVLSAIKHGKTGGQWSFLFVKENGEIISIDRFKELVITLVVIVAIMFITATGFILLYKSEKGKSENLKKTLKSSEQKIAALQEEKDVLMVRLVLAESRVRDKGHDLKENTNGPSPEMPSNESSLEEENAKTDGLEKTAFSEPMDATETVIDNEISAIVNVKNVDIFYDTKNNILNVKFILKKTDASATTVSGRAFVLLNRDKGEVDPLVIPSVSLSSGKPSQIKRGQYFSITHLKWMNFKKKFQSGIKSFKYLTIFIFSTEGKLLLEKEMAI